MERINDPTAVSGAFVEGDPLVAQPATRIRQSWLNQLQEEIVGLIEFVGLVPSTALDQLRQAIVNLVRPLGSIYITTDDAGTPGSLWSWQTWVEFGSGKVMVGRDVAQGEFAATLQTGGAKAETLTEAQVPALKIDFDEYNASIDNIPKRNVAPPGTGSAQLNTSGGGGAHNNLQPYIVVRMWKRTA